LLWIRLPAYLLLHCCRNIIAKKLPRKAQF
jgi:hypothetical protein